MFETNQEDTKFQASLGYVTRPHFKKKGEESRGKTKAKSSLIPDQKKKKKRADALL